MQDQLAIDRQYSAKEASKLLGIAYGTVLGWKKRGHYIPSITDMKSKRSFYSFKDLVCLETMRTLSLNEKYSSQSFRRLVPRLKKILDKAGDALLKTSILIFEEDLFIYQGDAWVIGEMSDPDLHVCVEVLHDRIQESLVHDFIPGHVIPGELLWVDGVPVRA